MSKAGRPRKSIADDLENEFLKGFIKEVEEYMKRAGKTQNEIAAELEMHPPFFNRILKGSNVTAQTINKVLNHIGRKVEFLENDNKET